MAKFIYIGLAIVLALVVFVMLPHPKQQIIKIRCGDHVGTAFPIGDNLVTAAHVISDEHSCVDMMDNSNHKVLTSDAMLDYAVLTSGKKSYQISCEPMVTGQTYFAMGYPAIKMSLVSQPIIPLPKYQESRTTEHAYAHQRQVSGIVQPGMSGGPVVDQNGKVVAFITALSLVHPNMSLVKEIRDTPLCNSDK